MGGLPHKPQKRRRKKRNWEDHNRDPYYCNNSVRIFDIDLNHIHRLRLIILNTLNLTSLPRASVYGRDGTDKGINLNKRMSYRHTYRYSKEEDRLVIDKIEEILSDIFKYKLYENYKIDKSHLDILHYKKTSKERDGFFNIHKDKINKSCSYLYRQFSVLICLDSKILSIDGGATHVYLSHIKHLFRESTTVGKLLMFPSDVPHGSEELKQIGEYKTVLKLDILIRKRYNKKPYYVCDDDDRSYDFGPTLNDLNSSRYKYYDTILNCNCLKCDYNSNYSRYFAMRAVFYGKHKKINSNDIIMLIASFRGTFEYIQKEEYKHDSYCSDVMELRDYRSRIQELEHVDYDSDCNGD